MSIENTGHIEKKHLINRQKVIKEKDPRAHQKINKNQACNNCFRFKSECFCKKVITFNNKLSVIILQHPQEQYKKLNSAWLSHLILNKSKIFVGLSWPSFKAVAGPDEIPSQWGILYLKGNSSCSNDPVEIINRKRQKVGLRDLPLKGIIALDGSWKQAKALWWRNPWFLKMNRITLNPEHTSLRNQTKKEGLSTIESIALALEHLGEKPLLCDSMVEQYYNLIVSTQ